MKNNLSSIKLMFSLMSLLLMTSIAQSKEWFHDPGTYMA
jgi:hypothetical protein